MPHSETTQVRIGLFGAGRPPISKTLRCSPEETVKYVLEVLRLICLQRYQGDNAFITQPHFRSECLFLFRSEQIGTFYLIFGLAWHSWKSSATFYQRYFWSWTVKRRSRAKRQLALVPVWFIFALWYFARVCLPAYYTRTGYSIRTRMSICGC